MNLLRFIVFPDPPAFLETVTCRLTVLEVSLTIQKMFLRLPRGPFPDRHFHLQLTPSRLTANMSDHIDPRQPRNNFIPFFSPIDICLFFIYSGRVRGLWEDNSSPPAECSRHAASKLTRSEYLLGLVVPCRQTPVWVLKWPKFPPPCASESPLRGKFTPLLRSCPRRCTVSCPPHQFSMGPPD